MFEILRFSLFVFFFNLVCQSFKLFVMKKKIFITVISVLSFMALVMIPAVDLSAEGNKTVVDNLNDGDRVICSCTRGGGCAASGSRGMCAQGQPGGNINCQDYNGNC